MVCGLTLENLAVIGNKNIVSLLFRHSIYLFQFVCFGGTVKRMKGFAKYVQTELNKLEEVNLDLEDFSEKSERFAIFKVGPVLSISVGLQLSSKMLLKDNHRMYNTFSTTDMSLNLLHFLVFVQNSLCFLEHDFMIYKHTCIYFRNKIIKLMSLKTVYATRNIVLQTLNIVKSFPN